MMPVEFDADAFIAEEREVLSTLLGRLKADSEEIRQATADALTLAAKIAQSKLKGEDTHLAEDALHAVRLNIQSAVATEIGYAILGYIEGALARVARTAGTIILTAL